MGTRVLAACREQHCRSHLWSWLLRAQDLAMKLVQGHHGGLVRGLGYRNTFIHDRVAVSYSGLGSAITTSAKTQTLTLTSQHDCPTINGP